MAEGGISFQSFTVTRVRVETSRSFDEVRSSLLESMGRIGVEKITMIKHDITAGARVPVELSLPA